MPTTKKSTAVAAADPVAAEIQATDGAAPPPLKPGWQTSEFWATHIFALLSFATAMGWIGPNFSHDHEQVVNAVALLASVLAPSAYAVARGVAKHGHQRAVGQVLAAHVPLPPLP